MTYERTNEQTEGQTDVKSKIVFYPLEVVQIALIVRELYFGSSRNCISPNSDDLSVSCLYAELKDFFNVLKSLSHWFLKEENLERTYCSQELLI